MNSSQTARTALIAVWVVCALLLTSAQTRVLHRPAPRRGRYLVAWLVCTLLGGGLLSAMDYVTGNVELTRRVANIALAATCSAAGLAAGAWLAHRPGWVQRGGAARFLALALIHAVIVLVVGYPFI